MCQTTENTVLVTGDIIVLGDKLMVDGRAWEVVDVAKGPGMKKLSLRMVKNNAKTTKTTVFDSMRYRIVSH